MIPIEAAARPTHSRKDPTALENIKNMSKRPLRETLDYTAGGWADPVVNARVALMVYRYDLERGHSAWTQWVCKP